MRTIVINSQKGGSGKTTLCAHLSVEAERAGSGPVFLIDTDPQGTLTTWHEKRQAEVPQRVELTFGAIAEGLKQLQQRNAAYCFIDTAPSRTDETAALFDLADLVIVPIRPSPSDLWAAAATVELLKREQVPFLVRPESSQGERRYHRASRRLAVPSWPGRGNLHRRPRALCRRHDGRADGH